MLVSQIVRNKAGSGGVVTLPRGASLEQAAQLFYRKSGSGRWSSRMTV